MRWPFGSRRFVINPSTPTEPRHRSQDSTGSDADLVRAIAAAHLPKVIRANWLSLLRPAVHLIPARDGSPPVARLGGLPDLPEGASWPMWTGHGPLSYIGEILCGSLADFELDLSLPAGGRLLFFYFDGSYDNYQSIVGTWDVSTMEGACAIHVVDDAPHAQRPVPEGVRTYPERWLEGRAIVTAPGWEHVALQDAFSSPSQDHHSFMRHPVNAEAFNEELRERRSGPLHQIGGYADPAQGPVEYEVAFAALGNQVPYGDARLDTEARRWKLLLQVDSDDESGMVWGDLGMLYWLALPDDLAANDLSKISFTWQCG